MTVKKAGNLVAKYLRKNFGVPFVDAHKFGKVYAKNYKFDGVGTYVLEALVRLDYDDLTKVFSKYFKVESELYYSEAYEEYDVRYTITPLCS